MVALYNLLKINQCFEKILIYNYVWKKEPFILEYSSELFNFIEIFRNKINFSIYPTSKSNFMLRMSFYELIISPVGSIGYCDEKIWEMYVGYTSKWKHVICLCFILFSEWINFLFFSFHSRNFIFFYWACLIVSFYKSYRHFLETNLCH